jgi:hypothetical protein
LIYVCLRLIAYEQQGWKYDSADGPWCWACSLPTSVTKAAKKEHFFHKCKWSDTMSGVAWAVWHDADLFAEMCQVLDCSLKPVAKVSEKDERDAWFAWLMGRNKDQTAYNIHALWLWYFREKIGPRVQTDEQ